MRRIHTAGPLAAALSGAAFGQAGAPAEPPRPPASAPPAFTIPGAEASARLRIDGMIQFRYAASFDAETESERDAALGFQLARTRFGINGQLPAAKLTYRSFWQVNSDGDFVLFDAWAQRDLGGGLTLRLGQFKLPFDRERYVTSPFNLLTIERSIHDPVFAVVRGQGVQASLERERVRLTAAFSDGQRADNTAFTDEGDREADYAFTGRAELRLGDAPWAQWATMSGFRGDRAGAYLGAGAHWQDDGNIRPPTGAVDAESLFVYTVDAGLEGDGWNLLTAFHGRHIEADDLSADDLGFLAQGGLMLTDHIEAFARYAVVLPDDDRRGGNDDFSQITAGLNYYPIPASEALRLSVEISYFPTARDDSASVIPAPQSLPGVLRDEDGGQFTLLAQVQMLF